MLKKGLIFKKIVSSIYISKIRVELIEIYMHIPPPHKHTNHREGWNQKTVTTYNFIYALVGFEKIIAIEVIKNLIVKVVFLCCIKILNSLYIFIHYCDHRQCPSFNLVIEYILNNSQTSIILLIKNDHMSCNLFNRIWSIKLSMHLLLS